MSTPRITRDGDRFSLCGHTLSANDALRLAHRLVAMALPDCTKASLRSSVANSLVSQLACDLTLDQKIDLDAILGNEEKPQPEKQVITCEKPTSPDPTPSPAPSRNFDAMQLLLRKA